MTRIAVWCEGRQAGARTSTMPARDMPFEGENRKISHRSGRECALCHTLDDALYRKLHGSSRALRRASCVTSVGMPRSIPASVFEVWRPV